MAAEARVHAWDHPRSRGVYLSTTHDSVISQGSSPLARGLPGPDHLIEKPLGIIPARAGFTYRTATARLCPSDHPRSRGVYTLWAVTLLRNAGSSPLARGLLRLRRLRVRLMRIIPARAGFTDTVTCPASVDAGSSPLARGLRRLVAFHVRVPGIIPARAGFTRVLAASAACFADHPRSRGVYRGIFAPPVTMSGSSPLARGLPHLPGGDLELLGIIPARAGFTGGGHAGGPPFRDHPRSRGVY